MLEGQAGGAMLGPAGVTPGCLFAQGLFSKARGDALTAAAAGKQPYCTLSVVSFAMRSPNKGCKQGASLLSAPVSRIYQGPTRTIGSGTGTAVTPWLAR